MLESGNLQSAIRRTLRPFAARSGPAGADAAGPRGRARVTPAEMVVGRRFRQVARAAGLVVAVIGGAGLAGWIFDLPILKSVIPGMVTMKANSSTCFLLAGIALRLTVDAGSSARRRWIARACGGVVAATGVLTLAQYLFGVDLRIDQLLVRAPPGSYCHILPGRMSPNTALNFVLLSITVVFLDSRSLSVRRALQWLAILALLIAFVAIVGYLYHARALLGVAGFNSMAIPTAVGFAALSLGVLAARPERGVVAILAQDNAAGSGLRRLLPIIVVVPAAIGWPLLKGHEAALYGTEFGLAVLVTLSTAVLASAAFWHARTQGLTETAGQQALDDQRFLLELGELLRTSTDAATTLFTVASKLARYLGASRCLFNQIDAGRMVTHRDYCDGVASLAGTVVPLESFGPEALAHVRAGHTVVSNDTKVDPRTAAQYENTYGPLGMRARIVAPLLRDGRFVGTLLVSSHEPRDWQQREVLLIQTVGERSWLWFEHLAEARALKESEALKTAVLNSALDAIVSTDRQGDIVEFNPAAQRLFGYTRAQAMGKPVADLLAPPSPPEGPRRGLSPFLEGGGGGLPGKVVELTAVRADGSEFRAEMAVTRVQGQDPPLFTAFVRDVSERVRADEQFRLAIEAAPTGMMLVDGQGRMAMVNGQIEKLFGYSRRQLIGQSVDMLVPVRSRTGHAELRASFVRAPSARAMGAGRNLFGLHQDGSEVPVEIGLNPLRTTEGDFVLTSIVDITERRLAEREKESLLDQLRQLNADLEERVRGRTAELTHTLKEREVLLQEIHHRVKNNLQVIGSLMNLQTRQLSDVSARTALQDCRARVEAIALIHEKLYQARDYSRIPFSDYARSLAGNIFEASGASARNVVLTLNMESLALELDQAIPCGLILNELITNALKHAFPDERSGSVLVELRKASDRDVCLSVADDGVGLPRFRDRPDPDAGHASGVDPGQTAGWPAGHRAKPRRPIQRHLPGDGAGMNTLAAASVLIVEDEGIVALDLQQTLRDFGYDAYAIASSADEAIAVASKRCPDIVLMDIRIKGSRDGIETAQIFKDRFAVPVVYLTAHADERTLARAKQTAPLGYLLKPVKATELRSAIEVALYNHALETRLRERERWYSTTLRSIADAVISVDLAGRVTFMNPAAEVLTGVPAATAAGKPIREVLQLLHLAAGDELPPLKALREGQAVAPA